MALSPTRFPPGWRPRGRDDVSFRQVGEGWILFDPATGRTHALELTAALLWSFCDGERDVPALEAKVRAAFGVAVDDPRVPETLEAFLAAGLLQAP